MVSMPFCLSPGVYIKVKNVKPGNRSVSGGIAFSPRPQCPQFLIQGISYVSFDVPLLKYSSGWLIILIRAGASLKVFAMLNCGPSGVVIRINIFFVMLKILTNLTLTHSHIIEIGTFLFQVAPFLSLFVFSLRDALEHLHPKSIIQKSLQSKLQWLILTPSTSTFWAFSINFLS